MTQNNMLWFAHEINYCVNEKMNIKQQIHLNRNKTLWLKCYAKIKYINMNSRSDTWYIYFLKLWDNINTRLY